MTRPDWLAKYPHAAALLQSAEEELLYDADADAALHGAEEALGYHARDPWPERGTAPLLTLEQIAYETAMALHHNLCRERQNDASEIQGATAVFRGGTRP
jgi:hypothetical protein